MNLKEENIQVYQLIQDNIIYILSSGLINSNLKLTCYRNNNNMNKLIYSKIFTIAELKAKDPILEMAKDCEDVQYILEQVILGESVGILEVNNIMDIYFYMKSNGRNAKIILRLSCQNNNIIPEEKKGYNYNEERISRLQDNANKIISEQNELRKQINSFLQESSNSNYDNNKNPIMKRSNSSNQNNYQNILKENNFERKNNENPFIISNNKPDENDNDIYEVPQI